MSALSPCLPGKLQQHRHRGHLGRLRGLEHLHGGARRVPDGLRDVRRARAVGQPPGELPELRHPQVKPLCLWESASRLPCTFPKRRWPLTEVMGVATLGCGCGSPLLTGMGMGARG